MLERSGNVKQFVRVKKAAPEGDGLSPTHAFRLLFRLVLPAGLSSATGDV
jgi:hypothetical protein